MPGFKINETIAIKTRIRLTLAGIIKDERKENLTALFHVLANRIIAAGDKN